MTHFGPKKCTVSLRQRQFVAPANRQKCVGGFLLYIQIVEFPGDFPGGFFRALFPTKMRRKNPARKSAKKSGGSKIKIREKSVLPKAGPKICHIVPALTTHTPLIKEVAVHPLNFKGVGGLKSTIKQGVSDSPPP